MRNTETFDRFSDNQRHALDTQRNLAVRANAGSGKTSVLIERIVQLLAKSLDENRAIGIAEIVAITFTRKAAAEVQQRLRQAFATMLQTARTPEEQHYWRRQLDDLPRAMIGTIDRFCGRILREFPHHGPRQIEPDFELLDDYELERLQRDAIERVINRLGDDTNSEMASCDREACAWWLEQEGETYLASCLLALLDHPVDPQVIIETHRQLLPPEERVLQMWQQLPAVRKLHAHRQELCNKLSKLRQNLARISSQTARNFSENFAQILKFLANTTPEDDCEALIQLRDCLWTRDRKNLRRPKGFQSSASDFCDLQHEWGEVLQTYSFCIDDEIYAARAADYLVRLFQLVYDEFNALCQEANRYSFVAVARQARDLLQHSAFVRGELKKRFRYVFVDEFQDTNQLQWEIVSHLVSLDDGSGLHKDRLFIVGDPQQSIYRFRHADVGVFHRVQGGIEAANKRHRFAEILTDYDNHSAENSSTDQQRLGIMPLGENYRSLSPLPLMLVDRVFRHVFDPQANNFDPAQPYEVVYQPFKPGLLDQAVLGEVRYIAIEQQTDEENGISEESGDDEENGETDDLSNEQVRAVVDQLVDLYGQPKFIKPNAPPGSLSWGDMAVLLPSRNVVLRQLEQEFQRRQVPYTVFRGIGFWQRLEISDVINLALYLSDPTDELALTGVLRSPIGQCSDAEILFLSQLGRGNIRRGLRHAAAAGTSLAASDHEDNERLTRSWNKLPRDAQTVLETTWQSLSSTVKLQLKETETILNTAIQRVDRMAHADLLQRVLEESGAYAIYVAGEDGHIAIANLEKLFDTIRGEEFRSFPDLTRLARRLAYLRDNAFQEEQATPVRQPDAVQIMTVHAAKGLEFPVVAVMKMEREIKPRNANVLVKNAWDDLLPADKNQFGTIREGTVTVKVRHPRTPRGSRLSSCLHRALANLDRAQEQAEARRLFYVAATRAKQVLILAGKQNFQQDGSRIQPKTSWQLWFENALGITDEHFHTGRWKDEKTGLEVTIVTKVTDRANPTLLSPNQRLAEVDLGYIHELPKHPVVATTAIDSMRETFRQNPNEWLLRYRLKLQPQIAKAREVFLQSGSEENFGAVVGGIMHRLLEITPSRKGEWTADRLLIQALATNLLSETGGDSFSPSELARVGEIVASVERIIRRLNESSEAADKVRSLIQAEGEREVPFALQLGRYHITGRFDKLLPVDPGYEIIDWKTDKEEDIEAVVKQHQPQMQLYALALYRSGQAHVRDDRIFVHLVLLHHLDVRTLCFPVNELENFARELEIDLEAMTQESQKLLSVSGSAN
ncbi:MAG: hypothetical protein KatS3mg105_0694 [Gemmatales bacterium]|nr:MAG: hypothetical protein KatS3mg105_0694 [Gemmatales bacterium]